MDDFSILEKERYQLLDDFEDFLLHHNQISQRTANVHVGHVGFFAEMYLDYCSNKSLLAVTDADIQDYMGNWYIRKVLNSKKSDVGPILASLKRFYKYLFDTGKITLDQYSSIKEGCSQPDYYARRFDSYAAIDWNQQDAQARFDSWLDFEEEDVESSTGFFSPPPQLVEALASVSMDPDVSTFLGNFTALLKYIEGKSRVHVTKGHLFFERADVLAMNQLLSSPELLSTTANQWDAHFIHFFYHACKTLGIFEVGRPEWEQEDRHILAASFAKVLPGIPVPFNEFLEASFRDDFLAHLPTGEDPERFANISFGYTNPSLVFGVFLGRILPIMQHIGLLKNDHD